MAGWVSCVYFWMNHDGFLEGMGVDTTCTYVDDYYDDDGGYELVCSFAGIP